MEVAHAHVNLYSVDDRSPANNRVDFDFDVPFHFKHCHYVVYLGLMLLKCPHHQFPGEPCSDGVLLIW